MKIAVWHNLPSGGGKRALYDHVRGLVEHGHTVESWCPSTADQTFLPLNTLIREHIDPLKIPPINSRGYIGALPAAYTRVVSALKAVDAHCRKIAREIDAGGFDVLFANACQFTASPPIARYVTIPTVLYLQEPFRKLYEARLPESTHGSPQLIWEFPTLPPHFWLVPRYLWRCLLDIMSTQGRRYQVLEEKQNAQAFDLLLVNSYFSRESLLRAYGLESKVCYLGVDTNLFTWQQQAREDIVIGVGAFQPAKNIELVIHALAAIPPPRPRLAWIGNSVKTRYVENLRTLAAQCQVDMELFVRLSDHALVSKLNQAALMAYAPRLEPFGYAPIEANACGLPVVAVAEGGVRETIVHGQNGLLVDAEPSALATAIEQLRQDRAYALALGQQGHTLVQERWTIEAAITRLEQYLRQAAEKCTQKRKHLHA